MADARLPHELALAREAQPLFEGHNQPNVYCLPETDGNIRTSWNDTEFDTLLLQMVLAQRHGLSYFIFDTYRGLRNGEPAEEFGAARSTLTRLNAVNIDVVGMFGFKYARMETMQAPRAILPIPNGADGVLGQGFAGSLHEPGREYDVSPAAARYIIDRNSTEWQNPAYLWVAGLRPYLSILMPSFIGVEPADKQRILGEFVRELHTYSNEHLGVLPYVAGVLRHPDDVELWASSDVDMVTSYSYLPDFFEGEGLQDYAALMEQRVQDWHTHQRLLSASYGSVSFVPSASIGWDASPRGEPGYRLDDVQGRHPYTPIVTDGSSELFKKFLAQAIDFTEQNVPLGEQLVTIFAWNEVTEGAALLPRLMEDGSIDFSYLNAVSKVVHKRASCALCCHMPRHAEYSSG